MTAARRLGRSRPAAVDRAHDDDEDDHRREEIDEALQPHECGIGIDLARRDRGPPPRDEHDRRHEHDGQQGAGEHAAGIEPGHRGVGQHAVDDEGDAGRNEVSERAAGGNRAQHHAGVVALLLERRQGDGGDRCRCRHRRARDRGEQGGSRQLVCRRPPGRGLSQSVSERYMRSVAAAHQDLTEQDEQRQLQQDGFVHRAQIDDNHGVGAGPAEVKRCTDEADAEHHGGDVKPERHGPEQDEEAHRDGGDVHSSGASCRGFARFGITDLGGNLLLQGLRAVDAVEQRAIAKEQGEGMQRHENGADGEQRHAGKPDRLRHPERNRQRRIGPLAGRQDVENLEDAPPGAESGHGRQVSMASTLSSDCTEAAACRERAASRYVRVLERISEAEGADPRQHIATDLIEASNEKLKYADPRSRRTWQSRWPSRPSRRRLRRCAQLSRTI